MNKYLSIILICYLNSACNNISQNILFTYEVETINHIESDYNGIDTTFIHLQNDYLRKWNKYDSAFQLYNSKEKTRTNYFHSTIDSTNYKINTNDDKEYKILITNERKLILGYKCKNASIINSEDTLSMYFTNEIENNYSPKGDIDGFVLEYVHINKNQTVNAKVIEINSSYSKDIILPTGYETMTMSEYENIFRSFSSIQIPQIEIGDTIPSISRRELYGKEITISSNNNRILFFNFWFIACKPCVEEIPELNVISQYFQNHENIDFYAFALDENSTIRKFLNKREFDFKIIPNSRDIHKSFGVISYPFSVIVDRKGIVRNIYSFKDFKENGISNIISDIEKLTAHNTR